MIPATMRSRGGADAPGVATQARMLAAPFANDAGAQIELATAEYDAGNYAQSAAAADRALVADPKSADAMIRKGLALVAVARAGGADPATWTAARRWFLAANKADPLYFYPVQLYYASFRAAKETPSDAAKKALLYAYKLNPMNTALRWEAARILLQDGDFRHARLALDLTVFGKRGGPLAVRAKAVVGALDANGAAAALALFS
jgi:Tfp pilus assembly protein PilF